MTLPGSTNFKRKTVTYGANRRTEVQPFVGAASVWVDCRAYIWGYDGNVYDVTEDLVSGSITRNLNEPTTANIQINNQRDKYRQLFIPMDRIVIFLRRDQEEYQAFTGYITRTPVYNLVTSKTLTFEAECIIRRLKQKYWDPNLPENVAAMSSPMEAGELITPDLTLAFLMTAPEHLGLKPENVFIQKFPDKWNELSVELTALNKGCFTSWDQLIQCPEQGETPCEDGDGGGDGGGGSDGGGIGSGVAIQDAAREVGWPEEEIDNLCATCWCESRMYADAHPDYDPNYNQDSNYAAGDFSVGLMQIIGSHAEQRDGLTKEEAQKKLMDPEYNLTVGLELWQDQGWGPWSSHRNGCVGGSLPNGAPLGHYNDQEIRFHDQANAPAGSGGGSDDGEDEPEKESNVTEAPRTAGRRGRSYVSPVQPAVPRRRAKGFASYADENPGDDAGDAPEDADDPNAEDPDGENPDGDGEENGDAPEGDEDFEPADDPGCGTGGGAGDGDGGGGGNGTASGTLGVAGGDICCDFAAGCSIAQNPHAGCDVCAETGAEIKAWADGEVITNGVFDGYNQTVVIGYGNETVLYGHLASGSPPAQGSKVSGGDVIAKVGTSADAMGTTPHAHIQCFTSREAAASFDNSAVKDPKEVYSNLTGSSKVMERKSPEPGYVCSFAIIENDRPVEDRQKLIRFLTAAKSVEGAGFRFGGGHSYSGDLASEEEDIRNARTRGVDSSGLFNVARLHAGLSPADIGAVGEWINFLDNVRPFKVDEKYPAGTILINPSGGLKGHMGIVTLNGKVLEAQGRWGVTERFTVAESHGGWAGYTYAGEMPDLRVTNDFKAPGRAHAHTKTDMLQRTFWSDPGTERDEAIRAYDSYMGSAGRAKAALMVDDDDLPGTVATKKFSRAHSLLASFNASEGTKGTDAQTFFETEVLVELYLRLMKKFASHVKLDPRFSTVAGEILKGRTRGEADGLAAKLTTVGFKGTTGKHFTEEFAAQADAETVAAALMAKIGNGANSDTDAIGIARRRKGKGSVWCVIIADELEVERNGEWIKSTYERLGDPQHASMGATSLDDDMHADVESDWHLVDSNNELKFDLQLSGEQAEWARKAADIWNGLGGVKISMDGGPHYFKGGTADGAVGVCRSNGHQQGSGIEMNSQKMGYATENSIMSAMVHEIGHALKMGHEYNNDSVMYESVNTGSTSNIVTPTDYDVKLYKSIWGGDGQPGSGDGGGEECVPKDEFSSDFDGGTQPHVAQSAHFLEGKFSNIKQIGGYREGDPQNHGQGLALDLMTNMDAGNATGADLQTGDEIVAYLETPEVWKAHGVSELIWQQKGKWGLDLPFEQMEDRGSPTQNHMDHVHVSYQSGAGEGDCFPGGPGGGIGDGGDGGGGGQESYVDPEPCIMRNPFGAYFLFQNAQQDMMKSAFMRSFIQNGGSWAGIEQDMAEAWEYMGYEYAMMEGTPFADCEEIRDFRELAELYKEPYIGKIREIADSGFYTMMTLGTGEIVFWYPFIVEEIKDYILSDLKDQLDDNRENQGLNDEERAEKEEELAQAKKELEKVERDLENLESSGPAEEGMIGLERNRLRKRKKELEDEIKTLEEELAELEKEEDDLETEIDKREDMLGEPIEKTNGAILFKTLVVRDSELLDFHLNVSDDPLVTHYYVLGDYRFNGSPIDSSIELPCWRWSTIRTHPLFRKRAEDGITFDPDAFLYRYGARPIKEQKPAIKMPGFAQIWADAEFLKKWLNCYTIELEVAYFPEAYPGQRIRIESLGVECIIQQVSIGFGSQWSTNIVCSMPLVIDDENKMPPLPFWSLIGRKEAQDLGGTQSPEEVDPEDILNESEDLTPQQRERLRDRISGSSKSTEDKSPTEGKAPEEEDAPDEDDEKLGPLGTGAELDESIRALNAANAAHVRDYLAKWSAEFRTNPFAPEPNLENLVPPGEGLDKKLGPEVLEDDRLTKGPSKKKMPRS